MINIDFIIAHSFFDDEQKKVENIREKIILKKGT